MQMSGAECFVLRWPEPNDFGHERMTLLLRIDGAAGLSGWGEAIAMWPEAIKATQILIEQGFLPLLRDRDIGDVEACWQAMKAQSWWYGEGGIASIAISAVDMALWDLKAKEAGKPLVALFGAVHESLPACASLHVNQATIEASVAEISGHITAGFRSTKLGLGKRGLSRAGRDPDYDVALVAALRAAVGPDAGIMVDAGNGTKWDVDTAIRTVRRMEEQAIAWIEEPFNPIDVEAHKALAAAISTPLAVGEREYTLAGYRRWLDTGIVDVFGLDPARIEGVTGFRRAAAAIEAEGKVVNAHAWSTAVLTGASLHLSLASKTAELFELKPLPGPMQFDLVEDPFWHVNGLVSAPDRPGHGAEPRTAILERYRLS
ncbi:mandelate racemase/muconate lactonizing enzyme family protein [Kaistia dalseonensis]|uniref:D-galactarolactone cycloisomerase n=1 Tax=Kaistia dalseonensis TaxID=410840 RepID=A0ABU0H8J1_9HYPH|nr:mandelate racemase/muconate lactonizing enzyme family protein [Kaistia dalseonensis]MCX5496027.1 mandelate racemase/muconate lactonizing enzyme family protein [Kaistia dalseonensis]MDQ0438631.1 D-galactarolactone cycloisomerase [Kaistia dalseonensis]